MTNILAISGSLRSGSTNTAVLSAATRLVPSGVTVSLYGELGELPLFNPDLELADMPATVHRLRDAVGQCDAMLICSPEYARGVSGAMKNALDWLVGSMEFPGKRVAVINASQRATDADAHLRLTLETMSASIVQAASIMLPMLGKGYDADDIVNDRALAASLSAALSALRNAVRDSPSRDIRTQDAGH